MVFLSVKPQLREAVFQELGPGAFTNTPLIVSVMSGVTLETLEAEVCFHGVVSYGCSSFA